MIGGSPSAESRGDLTTIRASNDGPRGDFVPVSVRQVSKSVESVRGALASEDFSGFPYASATRATPTETTTPSAKGQNHHLAREARPERTESRRRWSWPKR